MATSLVANGHQVTVLTTDALDQNARYRGPADEMIDGRTNLAAAEPINPAAWPAQPFDAAQHEADR